MHNLRRFVTIVVVSVIVNVLIFVVLNERLNTVAKRLLHLDGTLVTRSDLLAKISEQAADRQRFESEGQELNRHDDNLGTHARGPPIWPKLNQVR